MSCLSAYAIGTKIDLYERVLYKRRFKITTSSTLPEYCRLAHRLFVRSLIRVLQIVSKTSETSHNTSALEIFSLNPLSNNYLSVQYFHISEKALLFWKVATLRLLFPLLRTAYRLR
jgi:hypothetical protein